MTLLTDLCRLNVTSFNSRKSRMHRSMSCSRFGVKMKHKKITNLSRNDHKRKHICGIMVWVGIFIEKYTHVHIISNGSPLVLPCAVAVGDKFAFKNNNIIEHIE